MSAVINRTPPVPASEIDPALTRGTGPRRGRNRTAEWVRAHSATLQWLVPVVAVAGFVNLFNLAGAPAPSGAEITNAMQAWSITNLGQLGPYTYTWDSPPLGWLQIAAWAGLTGGFARYAMVVVAAREAVVVGALISVVLLWFVSRRIGLGRAASGIATLVFALSPLAIHFHRIAYLDNVATPWLLLSLFLATTKKNQLIGFAGAATALGVATLTQDTYLLALPLVAFLAWRSAHPETRRYALAVAAGALVAYLGVYVLFAVLEGQFLPSANGPSLVQGLETQFGAGSGSGPELSSGSASGWNLIGSTFGAWFALDPVLVVVAPIAAIAALFVGRVRPFGIALLALVALAIAFAFGGYLPLSFVVMLLPIAALTIAGVVDQVAVSFRSKGVRRPLRAVAVVVALGLTAAAIVPTWTSPLRDLLTSDHQQSAARQAENWVDANVSRDSRLIVDDSMWVDLVKGGFATDNVVWYPKLDTDKSIRAQSPHGWKDSDYIVSTGAMRADAAAKTARAALANSVVVASFGTSTQRVQVRQIVPAGVAQAKADQTRALAERAAIGSEIQANPQVRSALADAAELSAGLVDPRIPLVIAQLATEGTVTVGGLPVVPGEIGRTIREVVISRVDGKLLSSNDKLTATGRAVAASLNGPFAAQTTKAVPDGLLIEFSIGLPEGIIQ